MPETEAESSPKSLANGESEGPLAGKIAHLIRRVEYVAQRVDAFDDRIARVEDVEKRLHVTAERMSSALLRLNVARFAPLPILVIVTLLAGVVGGIAGAALYRAHTLSAMAPTSAQAR